MSVNAGQMYTSLHYPQEFPIQHNVQIENARKLQHIRHRLAWFNALTIIRHRACKILLDYLEVNPDFNW